MTRAWFSQRLESVATFWRIERSDGGALGLVSHDRDLAFGGLTYRSAPGMVPSAIRLSAGLEPDSAEISGALTHDAIRDDELATGRFDGARIQMGVVDWETLEFEILYTGTIGAVSRDGRGFSAELDSLKAGLNRELAPRTAPTCRAEFCGSGCTLSPPRFTHEIAIAEVAADRASFRFTGPVAPANLADGTLRWIDGTDAGLALRIEAVIGNWIWPEREVDPGLTTDARATVREGCDHTIETCAARFANAVNFQGEPFLPGNDLLTRYPSAGQ